LKKQRFAASARFIGWRFVVLDSLPEKNISAIY
jgi:hypothetical protein